MMNCKGVDSALEVTVYETSESGNALKKVNEFSTSEKKVVIQLNPEEKFQTITGFGGSFTEASAHLLNKLSKENRKKNFNSIVDSLKNTRLKEILLITKVKGNEK